MRSKQNPKNFRKIKVEFSFNTFIHVIAATINVRANIELTRMTLTACDAIWPVYGTEIMSI